MNDQSMEAHNLLDEAGNPSGGTVSALGLDIRWQDGVLENDDGRQEPNGCFVETVIRAAIQRLEFFQESKFRCRENALTITKLEEALHWCAHRTADRQARGVEGTHEV